MNHILFTIELTSNWCCSGAAIQHSQLSKCPPRSHRTNSDSILDNFKCPPRSHRTNSDSILDNFKLSFCNYKCHTMSSKKYWFDSRQQATWVTLNINLFLQLYDDLSSHDMHWFLSEKGWLKHSWFRCIQIS